VGLRVISPNALRPTYFEQIPALAPTNTLTKALREDVPLEFSGSAVRVAVVLVARSDVMHRHGIDPYVRRIELNTRAGYEYIFVVGWGAEYAEQVVSIRATIPRSIVTVLNAYTLSWQGRQATAALLVCQSNVSYLARMRELQQEVIHALRLSIPEIESEQVQVAKIARELGVGCKVAVRGLNVGDKIDPVSACIGEDGNLASEVCRRLGGEYVSFVYWDEDPKTFIANALYPLRGDHIDGIDVDDASLVAYVRVQNKYAAQRAVGKNGVNVSLASQLTGYQLFIEGPLVSDPSVRDRGVEGTVDNLWVVASLLRAYPDQRLSVYRLLFLPPGCEQLRSRAGEGTNQLP